MLNIVRTKRKNPPKKYLKKKEIFNLNSSVPDPNLDSIGSACIRVQHGKNKLQKIHKLHKNEEVLVVLFVLELSSDA